LISIRPATTSTTAAAWYQAGVSPISAIAMPAANTGGNVSDADVSTGPLRRSEAL
jgi:hypothetical protein